MELGLGNFSDLVHSTHTYLAMKMKQSVPKRRHISFRAGELPRRKHTTFWTRRKFEIKNIPFSL